MTLAITAVLCFAFGALVQFVFSKVSESMKHVQVARSQAYVDYLRALTEAVHARTEKERKEAAANAIDAKVRLVVFAERDVLEAVADFEEFWPTVGTAEAHAAFLRLVGEMRFFKGAFEADDVSHILLGFGIDGPGGKFGESTKEKVTPSSR